jgi:hypothetical protein
MASIIQKCTTALHLAGYRIVFEKLLKKLASFRSRTNVGSVNSLNQGLKSLSDRLGKLSSWSFSSANWNKNWNGKDAYRQRNIKKQYLGLIEEIENIF